MLNPTIFFCIACFVFLSSCGTSNPAVQKPRDDTVSSFQLEQRFLAEVNKVRAKARACGDERYSAAPALILNTKLTLASRESSSQPKDYSTSYSRLVSQSWSL